MSREFLFGAWISIGLVVLVLARIQHTRKGEAQTHLHRAVYDGLYPQRKSTRVVMVNTFVVPVLAAIAMVLLWPLALVLMIGGRSS